MAAKIVLSACTVLLVLQVSCASVLLRRSLSDFINDGTAKLSVSETIAKNKIDEIIDNLQKFVEQIKQQAQELAKKAAAIVQEVEDKATEIVQNAKNNFDNLKQQVENLKDKAEQFGEGVKTCAGNNEDKAKTIIQTAESDVQSCVTNVVKTGKPLVANFTETVQKVTDLGSKIASLVTKCLPSGTNFVTALPCFALNSVPILGDAKNDISVISEDMAEMTKLAPQLKTELDTCADQAKSTATQVQQVIQDMKTCVSDNMTTTAASA